MRTMDTASDRQSMDTGKKYVGNTVGKKIIVLVLAAGIVLMVGIAPFITTVTKYVPPPLTENVRIVADDIYRTVERGKRIPVEVALPHVARLGLSQFVRVMPLDEAVRARVQARLEAEDFVDELVPFLLTVKDMYIAPNRMDVVKFAEYIEANYTAGDNLPGMQHSMFSWVKDEDLEHATDDKSTQGQPSDKPKSQGFGLSMELAAQLVNVYDALYLVDNAQAIGMLDRLSCTDEEITQRLDTTAQNVKPAVQTLLRNVRAAMADNTEISHSIDGILADQVRLETITLSLIHFIDLMVCKHYQMFASRITREQQLADWMAAELDKPLGGQLWAYLDYAQNQRKYGVVIAVDGLQGHLIETLASNDFGHPFMQSIATEQQRGMAQLAPQDADKLAQQSTFLEHFAKHGFQHNAYLPFFTDLYNYAGTQDQFHPKGIARGGISTTPTISVRNLPIIKTGAPVAGSGGTGVPNFHFVDRQFELNGVQQGRAYYFFGNDALQLTSLTRSAGMRTLYERLPNLSSYNCAAQYDEFANAGIDPFLNLALGEAIRDFGEVLCFKELQIRLENELTLQSLRQELMALRPRIAIDAPWYNWYLWWDKRTAEKRTSQLLARIAELESRGMPELMIYYNPWPDHFAHFTGPFADEILAPSGELARLDYWLGQLTKLYEQAGLTQRTLFGMSGDHGLAPVFELVSPQARVLDPLVARGVDLKVIKISSDEGEGPKLTHVLRPPSMRGYDVVIASTAGGNLMLDLFNNQSDQWAVQPIETDLRRWQPIAWQQSNIGKTIDLVDEILNNLGETLEYLVVRTASNNSAEESSIALFGPGGEGQIRRQQGKIHYQFSGRDLLKLATPSRYQQFSKTQLVEQQRLYQLCVETTKPQDKSSWCNEDQWRQLSAFTSKPDSVVQLAHLYDSDRAGTINLFPADGVAYNSIVPGRHAGESFHEKDAFAGIWGAPVVRTNDARLSTALGGSVPMTIFEHLSGQPVTQGQDGWGYPSLWNNLFAKDEQSNDSR